MDSSKLYRRITKRLGLPQQDSQLKPHQVFPQQVIVHVTYHKCLTLYYGRIMTQLVAEFPFEWRRGFQDISSFHDYVLHGTGKRLASLTDLDAIKWDELPAYRGSHFVRDPRDMVVSGYHYHLWTTEDWCTDPNFPWRHYVIRDFFDLVEPDPSRRPQNISYQAYLNSLDEERGMILEMIFRRDPFHQMERWNYNNPLMLELRYEDIIGNEVEAFQKLFEHYRFHRRMRERGVQIASQLKLANKPKQEHTHIRDGGTVQWKKAMPPRVQQVFKQAHGNVLIRLGYEKDLSW